MIVVFLVGWASGLYGPGLVAATAVVGIACGLLDMQNWPFDRHVRWLSVHATERMNRDWGGVVANEADAEAWLREHPERRDRATASMLLMAGRPDDARALLEALPPPADAKERFGNAVLDASLAMRIDRVPDLAGLDALASEIDDAEPRLYAIAQVAQMRVALAKRGLVPAAEARRSVQQVGRRVRLPVRDELVMLGIVFPGVVFAAVMFVYGFLTGWR